MFRPERRTVPAVPLTEARARLFPLVDDLLAGRTDRVTLSKRGAGEQVLRARDVERMEEKLAELRKRVAPEPRPLWGTATIVGDVDEMLREMRREADEELERRFADICGVVASDAASLLPSARTISTPSPSGPTA